MDLDCPKCKMNIWKATENDGNVKLICLGCHDEVMEL